MDVGWEEEPDDKMSSGRGTEAHNPTIECSKGEICRTMGSSWAILQVNMPVIVIMEGRQGSQMDSSLLLVVAPQTGDLGKTVVSGLQRSTTISANIAVSLFP